MIQKDTAIPFFRAINRRIAEVRIQRGLSQAQLAELMEVYLRDLQRWESERIVSLWTLYRLSVVLKCPITDFFQTPKTQKPGPGRPPKKNLLT